jgi:diguanylate cyclase (GGDEF)-like protein
VRQEDSRPFAREGLLRRAAPFALAMAVSFAVLPLGEEETRLGWLAAALCLAVGLGALVWFVPWVKLPSWLEALPPLAWFGVVAMLRASQDGALTGYGPLLLLPVLWLLLYGTRAQIGAAIACVALTLSLPIAARGGRPVATDMRLAIVWTVIAGVVAFTVSRLVEEIRRQSAELERLASTDTLTGLPNRRVWEDALPRELVRSVRSGAPVAIAILDLDHFKLYNDTNGHQGGDLLLKEIAAMWPGELRESDLLARYGGEEFALLLPDCGSADLGPVVEKVRRAMPSGVTASAGAAVWDGIEEAEELIRRADDALYAAKGSGRDRTVVARGQGSRPEPAGA